MLHPVSHAVTCLGFQQCQLIGPSSQNVVADPSAGIIQQCRISDRKHPVPKHELVYLAFGGRDQTVIGKCREDAGSSVEPIAAICTIDTMPLTVKPLCQLFYVHVGS